MAIFNSGNDCVQKSTYRSPEEDEKDKLKNVTNFFDSVNNGTAEIKHDFLVPNKKHDRIKFEDLYNNQVTDLFYPYDNVENFLNTTITSLSSDFITRFFTRICSKSHKKIKEINENYQEFCKIYREQGCIENPNEKKCQIAASMYYGKKNVVGVCFKKFINMISLANRVEKQDRTTWLDKVMPFVYGVVIFCMIISVLMFELWHEEYSRKLDNETITRADFTLTMTNLPFGKEAEGFDVKTEVQRLVESKGYQLQDVNFVFDTDEYLKVKENFWKEIEKQYKETYRMSMSGKIEISGVENENLVDRSTEKVYKLRDEIREFENRYNRNDQSLMIGKAFIMFNLTEERDEFFQRFKRVGFFYEWFGYGNKTAEDMILNVNGEERKLYVELPREPNDIIWQDLKYSLKQRSFRSFLSFFIGTLIITLGFMFLYYMKTDQTIQNIDKPVKFVGERLGRAQLTSLILSLIISLIGVLLKVVIKFLSKFEKHGSITNEHLAITQKLWKVRKTLNLNY